MLYAIAGSQGSGKSTLIEKFVDEYPNTKVITRKTSRSILSDWNITLNDLHNNNSLAIKFQEEILHRKISDEEHAKKSDSLFLTERTPIDLLTYTIFTLGSNSDNSEWLTRYAARCILHTKTGYDNILYINGGLFPVIDDNVRNSNVFFSTSVDVSMKHLYDTHTNNTNVISTPNIEDRIRQLKSVIVQGL